MKFKITLLLSLFLCSSLLLSAQRNTVPGEPTLEDRFPKRIGELRFSKTTVHLGTVFNNEIKVDTILLYNNAETPLTLTLTEKLPAYLTMEVKPSKLEPAAEGLIIIRYDASLRKEFGFHFERVMLNTNDAEMAEKNINITLTIKEYFPPADPTDTLASQKARIPESTYNFGRIQQGEKARHDFVIINDGQRELKIHHAKNDCGCIKTSFSKNILAPGDSSIATVEFDSFGKDGANSNETLIFINDPAQPEIRLTILGDVWK